MEKITEAVASKPTTVKCQRVVPRPGRTRRQPFIDMSGQKFGRWTVVEYEAKSHWLCRCECGTERVVHAASLKDKKSKSCGCLPSEKRYTHGWSRSSEYASWHGAKQRCFNPKHDQFFRYGGRGITMHPTWVNDFHAFINHIGLKPTPGYQLERIDNNGNYEPGNVRWATRVEQGQNKSNNNNHEWGGKTFSLSGLARHVGMSRDVLKLRLRAGWTVKDAIETPVKHAGLTVNGVTKTVKEWEKSIGAAKGTIKDRLNRGWTMEQAVTTPLRTISSGVK